MTKLFRERRIDDAFSLVLENARKNVNRLEKYRILNEDLENMATMIAQALNINKLTIDLNDRVTKVEMVEIPWNRFPAGTDVRHGRSYPCARVNYTFTINDGDVELLSVHPQTSSFNHDITAKVNNNKFTIGYQTLYANRELSEKVKSEVKQGMRNIINSLDTVIGAINEEVEDFNGNLADYVKELLEKRKEEIKKQDDQNNDLNDL